MAWSRDGASLLISVLAGGDDAAGVIRHNLDGESLLLLHSNQRQFGRVREAPIGNKVAVELRVLTLDAWLIDGS